MLLRASLAGSLVVVGCALGGGCGGSVAPAIGDGGGGGSGSSGSSGGGSGSGGPADGGSVDSGTVTDSSTGVDVSIGPCQPDGVPCITASQCCTEVCGAGVCGGAAPTCTADESPCQSSTECCSGLCSGDICVEPSTSCSVSSNANQCDVCLAQSCCAQLSACEGVSTCAQSQQCFDSCYSGPGSGTKCAASCTMMYPSTQGELLEECAANSCLTACQ